MNPTASKRKTILIIDDSPLNLQLAANTLNKDYELILVNSGEKGLRTAAEKLPDLILLDVMMPEMSGYEVCAKLKESKELEDIPVIFVTAKMQEEDIIEAYKVGGVDYLMKPFRAKELLARVDTHMALRESRQELERLNLDLREVNKNKDKLFSIISHDLRGNAGRMDSLMNLILMDPEYAGLSSSLKDMLNMVKENSGKNKELVEDILLWTRNQFDKIELNPVSVFVHDIIALVESQVRVHAEAKYITFNKQIPEDLQLVADKNMLVIILRNLISNAIKFSHETSEIKLRGRQQNGNIIIEVTDQGVGISKENIDKLFNKNIAFTTYGTKGEKGTGFGLELCADFAEKHNGKIEVESEPGHGSTFRVILPVGEYT